MGLFDNLGGTTTDSAPTGAPEGTTPAPTNDTPPSGEQTTPQAATEPPAGGEQQQSQIPNTPPAGEAPASAGQTDADINAILDKMSNGKIKDADSLKAFLPKLDQYTELEQQLTDLTAKMASAPVFANDEVRIYNELMAAGATKEQLRTFQKLNDYGSLTELSDRDARIAKMVMIDGVKPSVAETKVDREFKIDEAGLDEKEREILDDDLRVAAIKDRKELEKFKAAVSDVSQMPPEEVQLQQQAKLTAHQAIVKPYVNDVIASIPHMGSYNLSGKEGADAVMYDVPMTPEYKAKLTEYVGNYFMDGLTPVTKENTLQALNYARAEIFRENADTLLRDAYQKGVSNTTEALVNKYENRSGLKPAGEKPLINGENAEQATANFMSKVANRQT